MPNKKLKDGSIFDPVDTAAYPPRPSSEAKDENPVFGGAVFYDDPNHHISGNMATIDAEEQARREQEIIDNQRSLPAGVLVMADDPRPLPDGTSPAAEQSGDADQTLDKTDTHPLVGADYDSPWARAAYDEAVDEGKSPAAATKAAKAATPPTDPPA